MIAGIVALDMHEYYCSDDFEYADTLQKFKEEKEKQFRSDVAS